VRDASHHEIGSGRSCGPRSAPVRGPGKLKRSPNPSSSARRWTTLRERGGSRSRLPTHTQCQDRSRHRRQRIKQQIVALVERSPAATQSSIFAGQGPGWLARPRPRRAAPRGPCRRAASRAPAADAGPHQLVVTTAAATERTVRFPACAVSAGRIRSRSVSQWHVHEHDQTQSARERDQHGGGPVEATSPSSSTTASSGIRLEDAGERDERGGVRVVASRRVPRAHAPSIRSRRARGKV